jgi:hypothetical protein
MRPQVEDFSIEEKKALIRKEVEKHELEDLKWAVKLL